MRIIFIIIYSLICSCCFGQLNSFICGNGGAEPAELGTPGPLEFIPINDCRSLKLKCNFVFFYRPSRLSSGTFDPNNSEHLAVLETQENFVKWRLGNIENPLNCSSTLSYPRDSKVNIDVERHYIPNESAGDYFSQGGVDCPGSISSTVLQTAIDAFNNAHPNQFNFFFLENLDEVDFLENLIANNLPLNTPYDNNINAWFTGCSDLAHEYNSGNAQYIIMADFYTEYLKRRYFHPIYYPTFSNVTWQTITAWWTDDVYPTALLHELGHTILNQYHTNECSNIMRSDGLERSYLSKSQLDNLHKTLATKNLHTYVNCGELEGANCSIRTTGDHTINYPMTVFGSLTVKSGHQLTISSKVTFSPESRLIVERGGKLILDNDAILTTECGNIWQGIIVEGNTSAPQSTAGVLELKTGSIIENARVAISCNPYHIPWPNNMYYGGLIQSDGGTIRNCGKAVEFMKYGGMQFLDNSYFKGTLFQNCKNGVTIWASDGIQFDDCTFTNTQENGILPYDSWVRINGCTFDGAKYCISSEYTIPALLGSQIGVTKTNNFLPFTDGEGIRATSNGSITSLEIVNNNFLGGNLGVFMNGGSDFIIQNNDFVDQQISIPLYSTNINKVTEINNNNISSSQWGSLANWTNYNQYWDNCFSTIDVTDIFVGMGSIHPYQGIPGLDINCNGGEAAGNCFSKGSTNDIFTWNFTPIPGSGPDFKYVVKNNQTIVCKIPSNPTPGTANAYYEVKCAENDDETACGSPDNGSPIFVGYRRCPMPKTLAEYNTMDTSLTNQIAYLENLVSLNWYQKYLLRKYKDCLKKVKLHKVILEKEKDEADGTTGWRQRSITHLNSLPDFKSKIYAYGLMVEDEQYSNARTWLNSLNQNTEEIQDFCTIQNINLDHLENVGTYALSNSDRNTLYTLGSKTIPLNGYARALFYKLTGDRIPINLVYGDQNVNPRETISEPKLVVKSYPSLIVDGFYNVEIMNTAPNQKLAVNIYDVSGRTIFTTVSLNTSLKIDVTTWSKGMYIYRIENLNTKETVVNKFIKL